MSKPKTSPMSKDKNKKQKQTSQVKEIMWNVINSLLAGGLVLLGSFTNGFSREGMVLAIIASGIIAVSRFKEYWAQEEQEYKCYTINFI